MSTFRPAAQADDILRPMPPHLVEQPNPGACWRSEAIRELARQDAAASPPPLNHTASAALIGDASDCDTYAASAYELGHDIGLRHGWRTGWAWGLVCGIVATVGLVSALVVVFAAIDGQPEVQRITLQGTTT